ISVSCSFALRSSLGTRLASFRSSPIHTAACFTSFIAASGRSVMRSTRAMTRLVVVVLLVRPQLSQPGEVFVAQLPQHLRGGRPVVGAAGGQHHSHCERQDMIRTACRGTTAVLGSAP